jgi:hypothetical protein
MVCIQIQFLVDNNIPGDRDQLEILLYNNIPVDNSDIRPKASVK